VPVRVTVPVADVPPITLVGLRVSDERVGPGGAGFTLRIANLSIPPAEALICDHVPAPPLTGLVETVNVALEAPAGTVTLGATVATVVSVLERLTTTPPAGAGPASVTVPCDESPPVTVDGLRLSELSAP
jgi:hypothetical protein